MTENDPNAADRPGTPPSGTPEQSGWPAQEPSPWSAQGQATPSSQAPQSGPSGYAHSGYPYQPHQQTHQHGGSGYPTAVYPTQAEPPRQDKQRGGPAKLVAGVAVLALLVGGGAGVAGGYLAAENTSGGGNTVNALDTTAPAKKTSNAPEGSVQAVAQKLTPSVVQLQVQGSGGAAEGSGFIISSDGYILTNNHVIEGAARGGNITVVFQNGDKAEAKVIGRDPTTDIAVVQAQNVSDLPTVDLGRSDDLQVGEQVVAVGAPFELAGTVTSGIVSSLHRPVTAGGQGDQTTVMDAIQTDAAINPGNSGGPLANMAGQVIGINSVIYSPGSSSGLGQSEAGNVGIGFAIPIDQARRTANDIINSGHATQTYIGATVGDSPSGGAAIGEVQPGSPAEKAGLKGGDVITKMDDRVIDDANTLVAAVRTRAPGEKVTFTLQGGKTIQVTLGGQTVPNN